MCRPLSAKATPDEDPPSRDPSWPCSTEWEVIVFLGNTCCWVKRQHFKRKEVAPVYCHGDAWKEREKAP